MLERSDRLEIGIFLPIWEDLDGRVPRWPEIRELAQLAEQAGIDTLWLPDHFLIYPSWGFWEPWTMLTAIAGATSRATIGTLVTCTAFRQPAMLAKMADTLDEISGGRLLLGLGAGYPDRDLSWGAFGFAADHPVGRFAEAVEIIARLLREGELDFQGRYYQAHDCALRLRGPRPGGPPIWIGGLGPRMLRLTARWADVYNVNVFADRVETFPDTLGRLDDACREIGRDPATLPRTGITVISFADPGTDLSRYRSKPLLGSPAELARQLHGMHAKGLRHMACIIDPAEHPGPLTQYSTLTPRGLERFVRVIEELRKLEGGPLPQPLP